MLNSLQSNVLFTMMLLSSLFFFFFTFSPASADTYTKLAIDSRSPELDLGANLPPPVVNSDGGGGSNDGGGGDNDGGGGYNPGPQTTEDNVLMNPIEAKSIGELFTKVIEVLLVFAVPIIVLYIMYGGFLLVTAGGEAGKIEQGRTVILWAVVGGVILMGAKVVVEIIQAMVESL